MRQHRALRRIAWLNLRPTVTDARYTGVVSIPRDISAAPCTPTHDHTASLSLHVSTRPEVHVPGGTNEGGTHSHRTAFIDVFEFVVVVSVSPVVSVAPVSSVAPRVSLSGETHDPGSLLYKNAICPSLTALQLGDPCSSDPGGVWNGPSPSVNFSLAPLAHRLIAALPHGVEEVYMWKVTEGRTRYPSPSHSSTDQLASSK